MPADVGVVTGVNSPEASELTLPRCRHPQTSLPCLASVGCCTPLLTLRAAAHGIGTARLQVDALGTPPPACRAAASCVLDDRWLLVHGGFDGARCLGDAFVLDTHTRVWSQLAASDGLSGPHPAPRALHTLCAVGHGVVLYGGASGNAAQSSAHVLHSPAVVAGVRLQLDAAECASRTTELQCALSLAEAARDNAASAAARARAQDEVCRLPTHQRIDSVHRTSSSGFYSTPSTFCNL